MGRAVIAAEKSGGKARIQRPWLGVISQAVSSEMAESLGLSSPSGTLISALHPASPLKKAGAKLGDVIMSMNGKAIRNAEEMKFRMATLPLGEIVDVGLYRDGKERVLKVKTIAPPDEPPREETLLETGLFAGATVVNVNPAVIAEHDWLRHDDNGVVITEIRSPSVAARFLQPGDIIQRVNGIEIKTVQELKKAVNARVLGWNVIFSRDGQSQQIMVR
jgi:S1-C subfamily serine protease